MVLSERASHLLKALVEIYIREGRPVGSSTLAKEGGLPLGSASIRKILGELEAEGYVFSPHTSAGRVPTSLGYRLFIDGLVTMMPVDSQHMEQIQDTLNPNQGVSALVESTSELLASFTQMASLVLIPGREKSTLRQLEFLPLAGDRILVILVLNEKEVQNRIITVEREYTEIELKEAANYINCHFSGMPLDLICLQLEVSLEKERVEFGRLLEAVEELVPKAISVAGLGSDQACIVTGQNNLLDGGVDTDLTKLKAVFDSFAQKREILNLMLGCKEADGVQIFIGEEAGSQIVDGYSLVTAPYKADNSLLGVLAVLGPTRMPYQKVIPTVNITAKILSSALNHCN